MILQWSASDVDDDMRFAVATSIPKVPFANMKNFSGKSWGVCDAKIKYVLISCSANSFLCLICRRNKSIQTLEQYFSLSSR